MAAELAPYGIQVYAVCPGWMQTEMSGPHATRSVEAGAEGIVWLALQGPGGPTGGFFRDGQRLAW